MIATAAPIALLSAVAKPLAFVSALLIVVAFTKISASAISALSSSLRSVTALSESTLASPVAYTVVLSPTLASTTLSMMPSATVASTAVPLIFWPSPSFLTVTGSVPEADVVSRKSLSTALIRTLTPLAVALFTSAVVSVFTTSSAKVAPIPILPLSFFVSAESVVSLFLSAEPSLVALADAVVSSLWPPIASTTSFPAAVRVSLSFVTIAVSVPFTTPIATAPAIPTFFAPAPAIASVFIVFSRSVFVASSAALLNPAFTVRFLAATFFAATEATFS